MNLYGIIGRPVGHSKSPEYFNARFTEMGLDARYDFLELPAIEAIESLLPRLSGFNVTTPYKVDIMRYIDTITPLAQAIGAVNCVAREGDKLVGYNTDYEGFKVSLLNFIGNERPSALVFGTGGAARVCSFILYELGIKHKLVSRTTRLTYADLTPQIIAEHKLLINTTPLGMFPDTDSKPDIAYKAITPTHYLYDVVYTPPLTSFLKEGQQRGAHTCNGSEMWRIQAEKSLELYSL